MDTKEKPRMTRRQNAQIRRELQKRKHEEREAQLQALRLVRDHPDSTPAERLEAIKILLRMEELFHG